MLDWLDVEDFEGAVIVDGEFISVDYMDCYDESDGSSFRFRDQMEIANTKENRDMILEKFGVVL